MPYKQAPVPQADFEFPGVEDVFHATNVYANGVLVALWEPPATAGGGAGAVVDGVFIFSNPESGATELIEAEGAHAPVDDAVEGGGDPFDGATSPGGQQGEIGDPSAADNSPPGAAPPPLSVGCQDISGVNYDYRLSPNYALRDFSTRAYFKHNIQAQGGRSTSQIICNLKALSTNITERLRAQYPGFRINSGFRRGGGGSQHERGMAMDVQWPGKAPRDYLPIAQWCKNNLNYDQLIFEHGNSIWIHLSYDREKSTQRRQVLTYYRGRYSSGLKLYY